MLVDTHAHLNFKAYNEDRDQVIQRCVDLKMKVLNIGAAIGTSRTAVDLAQQYDFLYAAIGLHPIHVFDETFREADYQTLIHQGAKKLVAMGETGFDYHHLPEILDKGAGSIAKIKRKQEEIIEITGDNAHRLFNFK